MKLLNIAILSALFVPGVLSAQTFNDKIERELTFEKKGIQNTVLVANINGHITVTGYEGDKVVLEVSRTITGKTTERLEKGKTSVKLGVIDRADTLIFYVEDACNSFGQRSGSNRRNGGELGGWGYDWSDCNGRNGCRNEYDYTMNFTLKVPASVNLLLSTVNNGDIKVSAMNSQVTANNINGNIKLLNAAQAVRASTINGDVDIDFVQNPAQESRFYTLNGDINANFKKGLAARLSFESFNGSLYTNIDQLETLPVVLEKEKDGNGVKYKINSNNFKIGKGGVLLDVETFNGNAYILEK